MANRDIFDRQFGGVPPVLAFVGATTAIATLGIANQVGILEALRNIISKLSYS